MRLSLSSQLLKTADGIVCGIYAEADFCSEHERGLNGIHEKMGCGSTTIEGIERYQPSAAAADNGFPYLGKVRLWSRDKRGRKKWTTRVFLSSTNDPFFEGGGYLPDRKEGFTVWFSDQSFGVVSQSDAMDAFLEKLAEHGKKRDIAVFMGGGSQNPFNRGGLVIAIPSLVGEKEKEELRRCHEDARLLEEAAEKTGIRQRIREKVRELTGDARFSYGTPYHLYSISSAWAKTVRSRSPGDTVSTAHEVIFWINNGRDIYGWYTVEEIDDWLNGTGKVFGDAANRKLSA